MITVERNWTAIGRGWTKDVEDQWGQMIAELEWEHLVDRAVVYEGKTARFLQKAMETIGPMRLLAIAARNYDDKYTLYGLRPEVQDGTLQVYFFETPDECRCVCSDFYPREEVPVE